MAQRTTLILDDKTRQAARQLASSYDCSVSEAIRRAVVQQRDVVKGLPPDRRRQRVDTLERLFVLFEGNDPEEEVRRLKSEDEGS
ncbi:MAG: hypothetical protein GY719_39525 [bacterium]|nr:hypothetical protein [bacterium]